MNPPATAVINSSMITSRIVGTSRRFGGGVGRYQFVGDSPKSSEIRTPQSLPMRTAAFVVGRLAAHSRMRVHRKPRLDSTRSHGGDASTPRVVRTARQNVS